MIGLEELSCRRRVAVLLDYLDKELPADRRTLIRAHRRACRSCRAFLASLERTMRLLRALKRPAEPPERARKALRAALARPRRRRP